MLRPWLQGLAARLPSRCEVCRAWPSQPVCAACAGRFADAAPRCGRCACVVAPGVAECGACLRTPGPLDACHAALPYAYPWDALVARFKFGGEPGWAGTLAGFMRQSPGVAAAIAQADLVLPVPLGPQRLAQRGYNQALELARRLAPGRLDAHGLLRVRETPPQSRLDRAARLRNLRGAFALEPSRAAALRGRRLLLVDDVMTSGATLQACARALREAGAASVAAAVLARADAVPE